MPRAKSKGRVKRNTSPTNSTTTPLPEQIRILSVNACCLPNGYRNAKLPTDTVRSGFSLHFLLYALILTYYHYNYHPITIDSLHSSNFLSFAIPLFPICFLFGWMFGGQAARLVGRFRQTFCGWGSDYKFERLTILADDVLSQYDVVAVQELFGSIPKLVDAGHVDYLIERAKQYGLIYHSRPQSTKFPSLAMDTGLLILSRFPIEDSTSLVFSKQFLGEQFAVNRGAMHAKINLPSKYNSLTKSSSTSGKSKSKSKSKNQTNSIHFFTAHVSPSMNKLLEGYPSKIIEIGESARSSQFQELGTFINAKRSKNARCIVAGDFNADIPYPRHPKTKKLLKPIVSVAMKVVLNTMCTDLKLNDTTLGHYKPTFGYEGKERLLTNTHANRDLIAKTDDLIFCDDGCKNSKGTFDWNVVSMKVNREGEDGESVPFTHLSDHWGVSLVLPVNVW